MSLLCEVFKAAASLQEVPGRQPAIGRRDSQLLYGEEFLIEEERSGWSRGRSVLDDYQGWVKSDALRPLEKKATHIVDARMTHIYPAPSFKTRPDLMLSFMSRLHVSGEAVGGFIPVCPKGKSWVPENHIVSLSGIAGNPRDIVDTALSFEGAPYLYGGRAAWGADCSALVQLAAKRNGITSPRDSDQQMTQLGTAIDRSALARGDAVYFKGHVGIMIDKDNIINATVRHMKTIIEPLADLESRYEGGILGIRRFAP